MKLNSSSKILLAILFILLAYWPVSLMQYSMKYDIVDWFYPMRYFIGECIQNQVLPVWNPYTNLGYPIHTDPQSGALYPIVWLLACFGGYSIYTLHVEFILHLIIGFWGMKKLSSVVGVNENIAILLGLSYACCGFFVGNAQHLSWIISAAWIPFVAFYYWRLVKENNWKAAIGLSLVCSLLLTGGYPAFTITVFYIMGITFLLQVALQSRNKEWGYVKKFVRNNFIFGIAFLLQSLVFLKFFLESLPFLVRTESLSLKNAQLLPFSPQSGISFVFPFSTAGGADFLRTDISMANAYFGLIALTFFLFLILKKPRRKPTIILGLGLFFLLVSFGDYFIFREWLFHYVPMMDLFRYPSSFRIFSLVCFILVAGLGMQRFVEAKVKGYKKLQVITGVVLLIISITFLFSWYKNEFNFPWIFSLDAFEGFLKNKTIWKLILVQAPIQIGLLSSLLFFLFYKKRKPSLRFFALLIMVDLLLAVQLNSFLTINSEAKISELQERLENIPEGFPIPKEKIGTVSHQAGRQFYPIWYNHNLLQKKVAWDGYNNFKFKAYRDFLKHPEHKNLLNHQLLFEENVSAPDLIETELKNNIQIIEFFPNHIIANLSYQKEGTLTLLQYNYPGWTVELNKQEISPEETAGIFPTIEVPKGEHEVTFTFYPPNYLLYLLISFGSFVLAIISQVYKKKVT